MGDRLFTPDDTWSGGHYELALELGPPSMQRLRAAIGALWKYPDLTGCFLDRNREPDQQPRVTPDYYEGEPHFHCLGVARLPNGRSIACGTCVVREPEGSDWLDFYLPLAALGTAYPVGAFPFEDDRTAAEVWRNPIEDWLVDIGRAVGQIVSYRIGLIGWEASGGDYADEVSARGIPAERWMGYLWPVGDRIEYHPRNQG